MATPDEERAVRLQRVNRRLAILQRMQALEQNGTLPPSGPKGNPYEYKPREATPGEGGWMSERGWKGLVAPGLDVGRMRRNWPTDVMGALRGGKALVQDLLPQLLPMVIRAYADPLGPEATTLWNMMGAMAKGAYTDVRDIRATLEERPVTSLVDVAGMAAPATKLAGMGKLSAAVNALNPADMATRGVTVAKDVLKMGGSELQKRGVRPLHLARRGVEEITAMRTGKPSTLMQEAVRVGERSVPPGMLRAKRGALLPPYSKYMATMRDQRSIESVYNVAMETAYKVKAREGKLYRAAHSELPNKPVQLARRLDSLKGEVIDFLREYDINPRGRRDLIKGLQQSARRQHRYIRAKAKYKYLTEGQQIGETPVEGLTSKGITPAGELTESVSLRVRPGRARSMALADQLKPDFSEATVGPGDRRIINQVVREVLDQEFTNTINIDGLRRRIDKIVDFHWNPTTPKKHAQGQRFAYLVRDRLKKILDDEVDGYSEMTARFQKTSDFLEDLREKLRMGGTPESAMNALIQSFSDRATAPAKLEMIHRLGLEAGEDLAAALAGMQFNQTFGQGIIGRNIGAKLVDLMGLGTMGAVYMGEPRLAVMTALGGMAAFVASSPRAVGRLLVSMGVKSAVAKNRVELMERLLKAADIRGIATKGLTYGEIVQRLAEPAHKVAAGQPSQQRLSQRRPKPRRAAAYPGKKEATTQTY